MPHVGRGVMLFILYQYFSSRKADECGFLCFLKIRELLSFRKDWVSESETPMPWGVKRWWGGSQDGLLLSPQPPSEEMGSFPSPHPRSSLYMELTSNWGHSEDEKQGPERECDWVCLQTVILMNNLGLEDDHRSGFWPEPGFVSSSYIPRVLSLPSPLSLPWGKLLFFNDWRAF